MLSLWISYLLSRPSDFYDSIKVLRLFGRYDIFVLPPPPTLFCIEFQVAVCIIKFCFKYAPEPKLIGFQCSKYQKLFENLIVDAFQGPYWSRSKNCYLKFNITYCAPYPFYSSVSPQKSPTVLPCMQSQTTVSQKSTTTQQFYIHNL